MGTHAVGLARVDAGARAESPEVAAAMEAFRRIVRALRVSSRALEKELGLSGAQLFVLQKLAGAPASSIGDLAARTVTDQSSVSVVVSRLVEKKLVSRSPSKVDARRAEIALTAKGRALLKKAPRPAQERLIEGLERLDARHLGGLVGGLERLVAAMGLGDERASMFFEEDGGEAPERS